MTFRALLGHACQLLIAGTCFYYAIQALRTGKIETWSLAPETEVRSESPFSFWCVWVFAVVTGVLFLIFGLGFLG